MHNYNNIQSRFENFAAIRHLGRNKALDLFASSFKEEVTNELNYKTPHVKNPKNSFTKTAALKPL
jgi:hypothetical protein